MSWSPQERVTLRHGLRQAKALYPDCAIFDELAKTWGIELDPVSTPQSRRAERMAIGIQRPRRRRE